MAEQKIKQDIPIGANIRASQLRGIRDALHTTYDALLAEAEE